MSGKEFLEQLEGIDPAYIEAADRPPIRNRKFRLRNIAPVALAACFCLLVITAVPRLFTSRQPDHCDTKINTDFNQPTQENNNLSPENNVLAETQENRENQKNQEHQTMQDMTEEKNEQGESTNNSSSDPSLSEGCPEPDWDFCYNEVSSLLSVDTARVQIPGYFTQELTESDLLLVEPGKQLGWMEFSGIAGFDGEGIAQHVYLTTPSTLPDLPIQISLSKEPVSCGFFPEEDAVSSTCNGTDFFLWQYQDSSSSNHSKASDTPTVSLYAKTTIHDLSFQFEMEAPSQLLSQAKTDFEALLECFTYYLAGTPDLALLIPEEIPEWFERTLTYQEALDEADFGSWFLPAPPAGFSEENITRYKNQHFDYLSGLWTKGYEELRWEVHAYTESDAARLTSVADTKNYDLSLYPIPRAESVPEELREIVDQPVFDIEELTLETVYARAYRPNDTGDSDGWRMAFSVRYGDKVVKISSKGVSPEWVYEQLIQVRDNQGNLPADTK